MTQTAHTPDRIWIDLSYIDSQSKIPVLLCNLGTSDPSRSLESDAQYLRALPARWLVAADLLEALEVALDYMGFHDGEYDCQDQLNLINAAIAKAKGESQ